MNINEYWKLFIKQAHIFDFILLLIGLFLLITNIIGFFNSEVGLFNILWGLLGFVIIEEVFRRLHKKAILENPQSPEVISGVKENTEVLPQKPKNFWNYFPLILFVINIVIVILANNELKYDLSGVILIIPIVLMFFSFPVVVFAILGKYKIFSIITASICLIPSILGYIFLFIIPYILK